MSNSHRARRPQKQVVSERSLSPGDGHNEHAEMIRELESKYAEMLKPIRDLDKNFAVSLDVLEKYIQEVRMISIETINFANAGLLLQSSKEVYARKVDYLEKLFENLQKIAYNVRQQEKDAEDDQGNGGDEQEKSKKSRKRKATFEGLDDYRLISPEDIPQLADSDHMNFNNVGLTYITQLRACLLKPEVSVHVDIHDVKSDIIGRKNDFRVNWLINKDGMPCDLTLRYEEPERKRPDRMLNDLADLEDIYLDPLLASPTPELSIEGLPNSTSTPIAAIDTSEPRTGKFAANESSFLSDGCCDTTVAALNGVSDPSESDLRCETKPKRARKLPAKMTLGEFLYGKRRKSGPKVAGQKGKLAKPRRKKAANVNGDEVNSEHAMTDKAIGQESALSHSELTKADGYDSNAAEGNVKPITEESSNIAADTFPSPSPGFGDITNVSEVEEHLNKSRFASPGVECAAPVEEFDPPGDCESKQNVLDNESLFGDIDTGKALSET